MNTSGTPAIQDVYPDDFAHCFGCGRHNAAGHQLKSFVEGEEVVITRRGKPVARLTPIKEEPRNAEREAEIERIIAHCLGDAW